jgi:hypothetical protein
MSQRPRLGSRGIALAVIALIAGLLAAAPPLAAARTVAWSGYVWDVRPPGLGAPGPNRWSDSPAAARVTGSDLLLTIGRSGSWTGVELDNRAHLGYGTYRWVVASDLTRFDAHDVLGLFTYGGDAPSHNEIDIEPARWGRPLAPTGSVTLWRDAQAGRRQSRSFAFTPRPPYVLQFTWEPNRVTYRVTDAAHTTLLAWTVTANVPVPSSEVPVINLWRFGGRAPARSRTVRITSFTWQAPRRPGRAGSFAASPSERRRAGRPFPAPERRDVTDVGRARGARDSPWTGPQEAFVRDTWRNQDRIDSGGRPRGFRVVRPGRAGGGPLPALLQLVGVPLVGPLHRAARRPRR